MVFKIKHITLIFVSLVIFNCAASRIVRPLEKDQVKVSFDLGGPLAHLFNSVIPLPLSSVAVGYGVTDDISIYGGTYITEALYGVIHLDLGATFGLLKPSGFIPGISVSPTAAFMVDVWQKNFKFYPIVDANIYWNVTERNDIVYLGLSNWFETAKIRADGSPQKNFWLPSLNAGYTFALEKWLLTVEVKYMGFNLNSQYEVLKYVSPGSNGAMGIYLSAARLFK